MRNFGRPEIRSEAKLEFDYTPAFKKALLSTNRHIRVNIERIERINEERLGALI